jgi:hypothetical protein
VENPLGLMFDDLISGIPHKVESPKLNLKLIQRATKGVFATPAQLCSWATSWLVCAPSPCRSQAPSGQKGRSRLAPEKRH